MWAAFGKIKAKEVINFVSQVFFFFSSTTEIRTYMRKMTHFWVTIRMRVWTKHMSQFSSFASFPSVQFWLTCGENICCYSQKSIRHDALRCHCDVELAGYVTVNIRPKVLQLITWSTQGIYLEINPQNRAVCTAAQFMCDIHGTSASSFK